MNNIITNFTNNIQDYLRYNKDTNAIDDLVVNMFETILKCERDAFLSRQLEDKYYFVYIDATYIPVRRGGVSKEALVIFVKMAKILS